MRSYLLAAATVLAAVVGNVVAQEDPQQPTTNIGSDVTLRTQKEVGCFSSPGDMWDMGPYTYQTQGWCQPLCVRQGANYFALVNGTNCFCGDEAPSKADEVDSEDCNMTCNGYDKKFCGGVNKWMVYDNQYRMGDKTGTIKITTPSQTWYGHEATSSSSSKSSKKVKPTDTSEKDSQEQNTVLVTVSDKATQAAATASPSEESSSGSGPNTAGIAAGVVVGVVALASIIGGVIFFMRRKKQKELEDERRRHEAMTSFVTRGEKPPSTFSASDSRLEPSVMFQRRQSDGSIADNQDYSRRILKVTNPDDR